MKNKKGFTLIELLAIIVILAIIAVITVPIILDIIDNSKKGAAKDSAYGYKDAINKFYVSKLSEEPNYNIPNTSYKVSDLKTLGVSASGKEPESNSWVTIENNNVTVGCLQFDEYKVEIADGKLGDTVKGTCSELKIPSCPGCVFAWITSTKLLSTESTSGAPLSMRSLEETEYVTDYTELEKNYFLGFTIDENNVIKKIYSCGIENNSAFCLRGGIKEQNSDQKPIYEANIDILNHIYEGNCEYGNSGVYNCTGTGSANIAPNGNVNIYLDSQNISAGSCRANTDGSTGCN